MHYNNADIHLSISKIPRANEAKRVYDAVKSQTVETLARNGATSQPF